MEVSTADAGDRENEKAQEEEEEEDRYLMRQRYRWPREEALALLRIRSDMDAAFRDSPQKGPLWDEVARKLGEFGYHRSGKKCKEKFENIYKYHRRTKEGRSGRPNGKSYRFFEQLEALEGNSMFMTSMAPDKVPTSVGAGVANPLNIISDAIPCSIVHRPNVNSVESTSTSQTSSTSKESDGTGKKKRKLTEFFEGLMLQVIQKQENLQKQFFEALEKCERDRMAREEAWKVQELERIKRERELLAQERAIAAAKDVAVLSFLEKFSEQGISLQLPDQLAVPVQLPESQRVRPEKVANIAGSSGAEGSHLSSSRWPKEEIEALIRLRTNLDLQYQENCLKGPMWEEISAEMKKLGYDRNAKRCKEKWENMNKYFKRVKESNKKRPQDSRTCPYYKQLDVLYKDKIRKVDNSVSSGYELKPEEERLMQMTGGQGEGRQPGSATTEDHESENADPSQAESRETEDAQVYPVVASDPASVVMEC